jgi:anti-sigma-K factor RskA
MRQAACTAPRGEASHGAARRGFESRRERDARYCRAVDMWENRLAALTEYLPCQAAPTQVWHHIEQQIGSERVAFARPLGWQVTSGVLAIVVLGLLLVMLR